MSDELKRLLRRWAALPELLKGRVYDAIGDDDYTDRLERELATELLEEAARVGAELEEQNTRRVAEDVSLAAWELVYGDLIPKAQGEA